ncbi:MAG: STAS domain-containing protein [Micromonospora sp.]
MSEDRLSFGYHHVPTASGSLRRDEAVLWLASTSDGSTKVISVSGEVDMSNAHLLVELVEALARIPPPLLTVDLSGVTHFGAHGISALLQARRLVLTQGGQLTLRNPSPSVLYIISVTGARHDLGLTGPPTGAEGERLDGACHTAGSGGPPIGTRCRAGSPGGFG